MKRITILALAAVFALAGCQSTSGSEFGEAFTPDNPISVEALYAELAGGDKVEAVVIRGTVEDVCQAKGCWLTLSVKDAEPMRVSFRDYGFFVPKDIAGRQVVMKGTGMTTVTSVEELRHYAEDAGDSPEEIEAITEPLKEYTFVADGVKLLP